MVKIAKDEVRKYLGLARSCKQDFVTYDCHVHPLEVVFQENNGASRSEEDGLGTGCRPAMPETGEIVESEDEAFQDEAAYRFKRAAKVLGMKRNYRDACPECFLNHMAVAGVDISLLLPVASAAGEMERTMALMNARFGGNEKFMIGCSVPNTTRIDGIDEFLSRMKSTYGARAVKLHPNITEIDLASSWGRERAEAILHACGRNHLPLVVHGGRSSVLKNGGARAYGCIAGMKSVNWSLSEKAVVIAHAGAYECTSGEVEQEVLPVLTHLLSRHRNLFVDLSGLSCETQIRILQRNGPERIVFGSDALYSAPWREAAKLIYSLEKAGCDLEKSFLMIGSETPEKYLFERMEGHVRKYPHEAVSDR